MIALHFNYWVFSFRPLQDYSIEKGYDTHSNYGKTVETIIEIVLIKAIKCGR